MALWVRLAVLKLFLPASCAFWLLVMRPPLRSVCCSTVMW